MPPYGETVSLVKNPATNLPLSNGITEAFIAELFRGNIEDGDVPKDEFFVDSSTFRKGLEAINSVN